MNWGCVGCGVDFFTRPVQPVNVTDLVKRAAKLLLNGATLMADPCPYCRGVRVIHDGHAMCVGCGREPKGRPEPVREEPAAKSPALEALEKKLHSLSSELEGEADHKRQQEILKSINLLLDTMAKMGRT